MPNSTQNSQIRLLVAASGTGGHLFPAIATAEELTSANRNSANRNYEIEWLGVPNRLERQLVPQQYKLHTVSAEGFQTKLGLGTLKTAFRLVNSVFQVRSLLKRGNFQGVFTTGGYIAAPAILAARSLGLPAILHESNALPGKVTRWLSPLCTCVAIGFEAASTYLGRSQTVCVGTPVRAQFLASANIHDLGVPDDVPVVAVVGGSQGAVAVNRLVRQCAPAWLEAGVWIVHQTGDNDPDVNTLHHPHYIERPFYDNMAGLMQRATLVIGRAGAGTLTELAITGTPSILIPYPFAAEDHQTYNARVFDSAGAAKLMQQNQLTPDRLQQDVLTLLRSPDQLERMAIAAKQLAVPDSASRLAAVVDAAVLG